MKLAIIAAVASLGFAVDAGAQDAPRVTAVQALANGVREVCVPAYGLSAMMRASGAAPDAVREIFTQIERWPVVEPEFQKASFRRSMTRRTAFSWAPN